MLNYADISILSRIGQKFQIFVELGRNLKILSKQAKIKNFCKIEQKFCRLGTKFDNLSNWVKHSKGVELSRSFFESSQKIKRVVELSEKLNGFFK